MNSIRPIYLVLKNIGPFGNKMTRIDFPRPGESMLIKGDIGSGKSAILSALFWCVTGKKIKGNSTTLVNTINGKDAYVESAWTVPGLSEPLVIKRGMKPSLFEVSHMEKTLQSEMQDELAKIMHITDPQVMLNLCVLSVSKSLPFFGLDKQSRLGFLRTFIDTDLLDRLSVRAKETHLESKRVSSALDSEIKALGRQLLSIEQELSSCSTEQASLPKVMSDDERTKAESMIQLGDKLLDQAENDLSAYRNKQVDYEQSIDMSKFYKSPSDVKKLCDIMSSPVIDQVATDYDTVRAEASNMSREISTTKAHLAEAEEAANHVTSESCRAHFEEMAENSRAKLAELDIKFTELTKRRDELADRKDQVDRYVRETANSYNEIIRRVENTVRDFRKRNGELKGTLQIDDRNRLLRAEASSQSDKRKSLERLLADAKQTIDEKTLAKATEDRRLLMAETYRAILDNTWSFMTTRMIPYLNSRMPHYMKELGLDFTMTLDPTDITKPIFRGRPGVGDLKLDDLSTGQLRALSFCLAHSLRDLESNIHGIQIGFLAVDELASNFNPAMVSDAMDFEFRNMKETNSSLILITHDLSLQQRPEWDYILHVERGVFTSVRLEKSAV